jgi:ATP-binding cassette, subfamily C, bacterial LapB
MSANRDDPTISLAGRIAGAAARARTPAPPGETAEMLAPFSIVGALERLAQHIGKPTDAGLFVAALPTTGGQLDPRFVPFALARAGIEARWEARSVSALTEVDMPALVLVAQGGAILLLRAEADGSIILRDRQGDKRGDAKALQTLLTGDVLLCGHVDPASGASVADEEALVRRNPKLWLLGVFLGEKRVLRQMLCAALFMNLCALAIPLYMRAIYDRVVPNLAIESLWALSIGVVIVLVFEFALKHVRSDFVEAAGLRVGQAVQHRAMGAVLGARAAPGQANAGTLMTALRDVEQLALMVPNVIATLLVDIPFFFAFCAVIVMIGGWSVAGPVIGAGTLALVGIIAALALKRGSGRLTKLMQARSNLVVDVAGGIETIKANQAEGQFLRQWDVVADHLGVGGRAVRKLSELPLVTSTFLVQLVTVLVVVVGVYQLQAGTMTTGALVAVTMLAGRAMVPVTTATGLLTRLYQNITQFSALATILASEPERDVSDPVIARKPIVGAFGLENVAHSYSEDGSPCLQGLNLRIAAGERIALIGKSGSGKSTLLRVLAGLTAPQTGLITVDGHAMSRFGASHLRQGIAYAAQDAVLFSGTIWENILLGREEPDSDIVERAIMASGLDQFIARTVEGYTRQVGPGGSHLSGGQRQAVILARALIRVPQVLLLDEPTASMDITSERHVIDGIAKATRGQTLIIATHRMAALDIVDRVIWLDGGRIVADRPVAEVKAMMRGQAASASAPPGGTREHAA